MNMKRGYGSLGTKKAYEKLSDDISDIQCNTAKIQTNRRMKYEFSNNFRGLHEN